MTDPLYSERAGRPRVMSWPDLAELVWRYWLGVRDRLGLLAGSVHGYYDVEGGDYSPARFPDPEATLTTQLKVGSLSRSAFFSKHQAYEFHHERDVLLDFLELLHREWVALPADVTYPDTNWGGGYDEPEPESIGPLDKAAGQKALRDAVNPALRLATPPLELREDGRVHERPPDELAGLVDAGIPRGEEPEVADPIRDAIDHYSRRGASVADRLAAVRSLAGVLERLRDEIKVEALTADERALFTIANEFGIRHDNRRQRVDYDREAWLEWTFYVYLATARVMVRLRAEQRGDWPPESAPRPADDDIPF